MNKRLMLIGAGIYLVLWIVVFISWYHVPVTELFSSDASEYSRAAVHLLHDGFYSLDGVTPFFKREPGMSIFLAGLYAFTGVENATALFVVQGVLFFLAAWFFSNRVSRVFGKHIGVLCFLLLVTHVSVFHTIFSAYRECLTLILLLFFGGLVLEAKKHSAPWRGVLAGFLLGGAILTYFSFLLFPIVLLGVLVWQRVSWRFIVPAVVVPMLVVAPWFIRNAQYGNAASEQAQLRMTYVWHVRGEQAEKVQGLEPLKCLWAEYISRDWSQRSEACSFNGVKNKQWPDGQPHGDEVQLSAAGKAKILAHPISYLWFSVVDVIELHLPFVGGGWSTIFHAFAALASVVLFAGIVMGLPMLADKRFLPFLALAAYNTLIFCLTDATPRYLLPVVFCYALVAAYGYHRLLWDPLESTCRHASLSIL